MNFGKLGKVETAQTYLDIAFRQSKEAAMQTLKSTRGDQFKRIQKKEMQAVSSVKNILQTHFRRILVSFPSLDNLDPFYKELIRTVVDVGQVKQSLGGVNWGSQRIEDLYKDFYGKMRYVHDVSSILALKRSYFGRVSSVVKKLKYDFIELEDARKKLRVLPQFKTSIPTIVIAGFPNVGKTTLLKSLTGSAPDIASYPFTTKSLMLGYRKHGKETWQIIDTPGLLDRPLKDRNKIERQAAIALKYLAKAVVFVMDPSESCGYPLAEQRNLLKEVSNTLDKPVVVVLNKSDLSSVAQVDDARKNLKNVVLLSAEKGKGIQDLIAEIGRALP